ncbi:hypothetical protein A6V25_29080 [Nostoc sp. ATCC 53789]|nr:hypothetical protein A6V25_29080 [Nostoc sp. ATCC 53789]
MAVKEAGGRGQGGRGQGDKGKRTEDLKQVFPLVPNSPCPQVLFPIPNAQKQDPPSRIFHRARGITYMVVYKRFGIVPYESIL